MIHCITLMSMFEAIDLPSPDTNKGFGQYQEKVRVNHWEILRTALEKTNDRFVFITNPAQHEQLAEYLKTYKLDKYLVVQSDVVGNRNYKNEKRIKLWILQGKKEHE